MPPFPLRAVLFDLDGTLIHVPLDFATMRELLVETAADFGADLRPHRHRDVLSLLAEGAAIAGPGFRERAERLLEALEVAAAERAQPAPGAGELLADLKQGGLGVGIVTRNCPAAVETALRRIRLPHDVLLTRADTPRVKPDPAHLLHALRLLGVEAREAAMVGDHPMDVQAGRQAGTWTVRVLPPHAVDDGAAHRAVRRLDDLRPCFGLPEPAAAWRATEVEG